MIENILGIALSLVVVVLVGKYWRWLRSSFVHKLSKIPGPKGLPVIGIIASIPREKHEMLDMFQNTFIKKYGRIYCIWLFSRHSVCISTPSAVEKILASQKLIDKGPFYGFLYPWLGSGLLLASGSKWRRNRRLLTPAFHFQILDNFFDVFNKNADIFCDLIDNEIANNNSVAVELEMFSYLKRCTLDIICETAMGIRIDAQTNDSNYLNAVYRISEISVSKISSLWQFFPESMFRLLSPAGREYSKHLHLLHEFTSKVIRDRKKEMELENDEEHPIESSIGSKKRRAFLDLLLIEAKKGADLTDLDIRYEVDTFMFEGHDTTAAAMMWFLYCMGTHPEHQEIVWNELNEVFGDSDRPCTLEDTSKLKYLEACIKEGLRLYPSVPLIERTISENVELDGYHIPAGTSLTLQFYALHRNETLFQDANAFKPEHFIMQQHEDGSVQKHPYAYVPFSAGPRNCIGQRFALLEEKVILSTLLRRFRFAYDTVKHGPAKPCFQLILKPSSGVMPLIVSHRR